MDLRKRKIKVKLFLPTPWRHMVGGSRGILHLFINSGLNGGDRAMEDRKKRQQWIVLHNHVLVIMFLFRRAIM